VIAKFSANFKNNLFYMEIIHKNNEEKGAFIASDNNVEAGQMTYVWTGPDRIIIDHTEVNPLFSGKGVGKKLLLAVVEFAREKNLKVIPLCPFAKAMFDKIEAIRDVL